MKSPKAKPIPPASKPYSESISAARFFEKIKYRIKATVRPAHPAQLSLRGGVILNRRRPLSTIKPASQPPPRIAMNLAAARCREDAIATLPVTIRAVDAATQSVSLKLQRDEILPVSPLCE